ncbi:MAG: IS66 family transposase [Planctomycetes bacterium]|nr:IS66 family transposase [Planctomycetota bacterium]
MDLSLTELEAIVERSKTESLNEQDCEQLHSVLQTLFFLTQELEKNRVSVQRLKQMLFGATTEKTSQVLEDALAKAGAGQEDSQDDKKDDPAEEKTPPKKPKGHGRNGADKYTGAQKIKVNHPELKAGDSCPDCEKGKVYETAKPTRLVRVHGQAPLRAKVYELQKLRCNLCGKIFTAPAPSGVGEEKYDAEAAAMIALLKYGSGLPFNRLERLQGNMGIPLPAATQWEIGRDSADRIKPALKAMIRQAAQGQVVHNDDTTMKILKLDPQSEEVSGRKGVFTSGIVSILEGHRIALFFTGNKHAGENLMDVLQQRGEQLDPPIQMCDALSRNMPEELKTIISNCLAHGRRRFVEVAENFPQECLYVLEILKDVYKYDDEAREKGLYAAQRLQWHKDQSGPKMAELHTWLTEQIEQHKVEPNSTLGNAITYMLKHWQRLTLFLREPGAPLDNNICERALKKAILHRKNAYFYKTENGARVGDLFMSLIHTCELNKVNPFDYLTELQKHTDELTAAPDNWMPWNYRDTLQANQAT